jgi:AAA domain
MNDTVIPPHPLIRVPVDPRTHQARERMRLTNIVSGPIDRPLRVLIYGVDGIGKSTFAASAPSPIFIGTEDGTNMLDVPRFPEPASWIEALAAVEELASAAHEFETLVIDTLDWLEPLCWQYVCAGRHAKSGKPMTIDDFPFGDGYKAALAEWRHLLAKLETLRALRGMAVVLVAHSWIRSFKNPEGDSFDRHECKLNNKASGLMREWSDVVLFATHETFTREDDSGHVKGVSTGARIVHTERHAAFDAKNRHALPPTLPLDWDAFAAAVSAKRPADPAWLRARISAALDTATDPTLRERVQRAVADAGDDASKLARILNKLTATVGIEHRNQETTP